MPKFSKLLVTDIYNTTREAVVINLRPENPLEFNFMQGQYLTFKKKIRGNQIRRSYSICSSESESLLQVAIKKVEGGVFSNWANTELQSGDFIYSLPPRGSFYADVEGIGEEYLAVAGGSGITPILSILKTTLSKSSSSRFTLIYSNRNINTVMFREELEDLK
ncbi:MAG: FAD-binding oxidoreductase, partial [Pseudomonadota bacterium]|nr:FAD-binding oxidoreductase [Pseudomonadota bacterium]